VAERRHPAERVPPGAPLAEMRDRAADCRACDLWEHATQTVFGAGAAHALVMLVGEQPGDQEDLAGKPFVGPAGRVLEEALVAAGLDPARVYLTNAVKHFKWIPRGKRRLHAKPRLSEVLACRPWLGLELAKVRPRVIVCLGTTAARAVLGRPAVIGKLRGQPLATENGTVFVTSHPSAILRAPDAASRERGRAQLVADLAQAAKAAATKA
jgi:uracil-DNA glycosylase family protein